MSKFKLTIFLFLIGFSPVFAQNTRDSSSAEIKQQAVEMRDKLNKYIADKLLEEQLKKDPQSFFDSVSSILSKQQLEIDKLKEQFNKLEKQLNEGTYGNGATRQKKIEGKDIELGANSLPFQRVGDKQLNLYFLFDEFALSNEQCDALRAFLNSQKVSVVKVNGYTDWIGTKKYNKKLSENRCLSAIKVMNEFSIRTKVSTFINCNNNGVYDDQAAMRCRRVEIIIK